MPDYRSTDQGLQDRLVQEHYSAPIFDPRRVSTPRAIDLTPVIGPGIYMSRIAGGELGERKEGQLPSRPDAISLTFGGLLAYNLLGGLCVIELAKYFSF